MPEIDLYIREHAAKITPAVLQRLLPKLPLLKMEFTQITAPAFPQLFEQLEFLAEVVEDFAEGADEEIPYGTIADAVFALLYVHKHCDMLPDHQVSDHADDSKVVRAVMQKHHKELKAYAARHDVAWAGTQ